MSAIQQQIELYGEPLRDRFQRVIDVYGIPQRRLARVLGLSAPMLSQLISATRTKIGSPAVYERLVLLEQRAGDEDRQAVLTDVEATQHTHSTTQLRSMTQHALAELGAGLAAAVPLAELQAAATQIESVAPALHRVLREAISRAGTSTPDVPPERRIRY